MGLLTHTCQVVGYVLLVVSCSESPVGLVSLFNDHRELIQCVTECWWSNLIGKVLTVTVEREVTEIHVNTSH